MTIIWSAQNNELLQISENISESETVISSSLGYDTDTSFTFGVTVALTLRPGYHPTEGVREIVFYLYALNENAHVESTWFNGADTKPFIPDKSDRAYILGTIQSLLEQAIVETEPNILFMCASEANLPEQALRKYQRLGDVMSQNGYKTGQSDLHNGYMQWTFEKLPKP
jgi:hypothetical protein